jgi:hypothetical protein
VVLLSPPKANARILSRDGVSIDGVWIGNWICGMSVFTATTTYDS